MSRFTQLVEYHVHNSKCRLTDLTEREQNEVIHAFGKELPKDERWDLLDTNCPMPDATLDAIKDGDATILLMMWRDIVYDNTKEEINREFQKAWEADNTEERLDQRDRARDMRKAVGQ